MKEIQTLPGEHIDFMIKKALKEKKDCYFMFNGIKLVKKKKSTFESMQEDWNTQNEKRRQEYLNSDKYKESQKKDAEEVKELEKIRDNLMIELDSLDFNDYHTALKWICKMQDPSDRVGVLVDKDKIISTFEENGYLVDMNCGDDYNENDAENSAKYIIGQGLSTLQKCSIHHMVLTFTERWEDKFK